MPRPAGRATLLRLGFQELDDARDRLALLGEAAVELQEPLAETPDPDLALRGLVDLLEAVDDPETLRTRIVEDRQTARRLLQVLGGSRALSEHLLRHPEQWRELDDDTLASTRAPAYFMRECLVRAVGADPQAREPIASIPDTAAVDALRVEYRRLLLRLVARDLAHAVGVDDVAAELSDLAAGTLEAALAVARARVGEETAGSARLAVIAMGKCGGHELNYVSDVDVVFVFEPAEGTDETRALRAATQLAANLMQVCSEHTAAGTIWPVDAALRPEGKAGPLVRTLASHEGYYERWAKTWEFQALLKARPVAGDRALGAEYVAMVAPFVWAAASRDGFVADVQAMRRRVLEHLPAAEASRQLKLGSGGLRDVEFAVQLLQLVHGRTDAEVRAPTTLSALHDLTQAGYVGRDDGRTLHDAYCFLRSLEHRIQLFDLRRTHVVPDDDASLRRLGRSLGHLKDPIAGLEKQWRHHRREVRRLHEKLFYRPLLSAVARIPGPEARLSPERATDWLAALGYADPAAALRHLEAMTAGVSRTAAIQRSLLPVMLEWFADAPDPDAGLWGFRRISESLGRTHWYLRLLRDEGEVAERLARVLATSRYATDLLEREPNGVRLLADDLTPWGGTTLAAEMRASAGRQPCIDDAARAIRAVRRRELLRIATGELVGATDVLRVGRGLTALTDATLGATLELAERAIREIRGLDEAPTRLAIIAMGRYGGLELSYGSDADVMFVHDPVPGADPQAAAQYAQAVANELRRMLAMPATDPPLEVDADLRPEGKQGPLVRTLDSYAAYYARWSAVWEFQALLRAYPAVGDPELLTRFMAMVDPLRFPAGGISEDDIREVRRIKARVDDERLPRGADPHTHLKLGRGGLADIEWTVQLLQMRHAGQVPGLRTPRTLKALAAAGEAGLLADEDREALTLAWRTVSATRNAITLVRGKPSDNLPHTARERAGVAAVLGYAPGESDEMVNDYLRVTRLARGVVERVFWG
ncbi:bifunctional [glutamine synthetase] adenylyltransferase/[glutamine synthetase]-adenylyl-L-tyrosine phosphorylase [Nocardioides daejeonensis]|uniref:bifunctional [glutamine synthetase] adenylyltransferase/[glutamine synthetase]-adenylyl-L-tyrosine phosphorylase n=1 Tax=Nocardioides daejeonensis TaxID=1046556 RepID=UPI000D7503FC|nr:bifunctional [glutamine synthetase] adenylyltransferase/[glutamine synthetase]-adenylyl-L-tyrosine phosphorylase [Nocardioides daejeonensis]